MPGLSFLFKGRAAGAAARCERVGGGGVWIPAFAGMTVWGRAGGQGCIMAVSALRPGVAAWCGRGVDSRFHGNDGGRRLG